MSEPVQTEETTFAAAPALRMKAIVSASCMASSVPDEPPGTQSRSSAAGQSAKVMSGMIFTPASELTGSKLLATSNTLAPIREDRK